VDVFKDIDSGLPVFMLDGGRITPPEQPPAPEESKTA
jgi:hypothetical protein